MPKRSRFAPIYLCIAKPLALLTLFATFACAVRAQGATDSNALAVINNQRVITQKEVDESIAPQLFALQQQIYALRKAALENLIARELLEEEAKRRRVSVESLKQELTAVNVKISQSEIEQTYAENASTFGNMSPDELKERIRLDLEAQARMRNYKAKLVEWRKGAKIEILLTEPTPPAVAINDDGPALGSKSAPVTIVEFSDFQCPFCRRETGTVKQILQAYGDNVRLVFKQMPLPIHPQAAAAACASVCADEQGRFWEYHDKLFGADDLSPASLNKIAASLGLNAEKFNACLTSDASRVAVEKDFQEAKRLGVSGTPTFFINGKAYVGAIGFEELKKIINRELEARKKTATAKNGAGS